MADSNPTQGVITVNSEKYTLKSSLLSRFISPLPGKVNIGPDEFDNQININTWTIADQRGGLGVSEMDERVHADRYWWSNCITDHKNHLFLPRLATSVTIPTTGWTLTNADMETGSPPSNWNTADGGGGAAATFSRNSGYEGGYGYRIVCANSGGDDYGYIHQIASGTAADYQSKIVIVTARIWADSSACSLKIDDGLATSTSAHSGGSGWELITVIHIMHASANQLQVKAGYLSGDNGLKIAVIDDVKVGTIGSFSLFANFNGELYMANGDIISKLNSGRTAFEIVAALPEVITALIPTVNSTLLIYLGDEENYFYMDTDDVFRKTNVTDATRGISWDSKAWKMNADGNWWHAATPNSATPSWTSKAGITDIASQIERLFIGKDANGDDVIYCATNSTLKVYDFTNDKWISTALKLPNHPTGGKGATYWHDGHYLSYGLRIKKYVTGQTATISETGLNRDDGLPSEYNGEITRFLGEGASDNLYALVDSSVTSGNSKSGLYAYDGRGWKCWWIDTSNNGAMNDVIISGAQSGYAIYWDSGGTLYYIDLHRGLQNVDQLLGTQKFMSTGIHISPWFDAGTQAFDKLFVRLLNFSRLITTSETVVLKYRTDKTNIDIGTGWDTLDTLNTTGQAGKNIKALFSGAGKKFQSIQFALDLASSGANTLSPDVQANVLAYELLTGGEGNWVWVFTILYDGAYGPFPGEQQENIETALQLDTLVPIIFRDTTTPKYCRLTLLSQTSQTGSGHIGEATIQAIEI